ncbi:TetR/AcrR family transcriptional regulator [Amycolatopsis rhabdoformis]|uniref:TetR/AcrR family transcriptional regulator n=1 Tax=Amycolatopsis rhabdoformis TaxID=1448059 RepID=A0ABZ1IL50_9PSEU|nr:TetR/AcrR family transcriptional regulator [Amycolatopsis rhabdoformis]WSE34457.1 TetR/AcrR family transcriptional regulator [Amycolatopsis rhabdoformis]
MPEASEARDKLLNAAVEHIARDGAGQSLRALAAALGTSHRMLSYHFGSKEGLLTAVAREVERRQRAVLAGLDPGLPPEELARAFWRKLTDETLRHNERLFFQLYGQALGGAPGTAEFLDGIVDSWLAPVEALLERLGVPEEHRAAQARLGLAVTRGLLLDLVTTGDREAVDAAMDRFVSLQSAGFLQT